MARSDKVKPFLPPGVEIRRIAGGKINLTDGSWQAAMPAGASGDAILEKAWYEHELNEHKKRIQAGRAAWRAQLIELESEHITKRETNTGLAKAQYQQALREAADAEQDDI
jgi:hypothetical protein